MGRKFLLRVTSKWSSRCDFLKYKAECAFGVHHLSDTFVHFAVTLVQDNGSSAQLRDEKGLLRGEHLHDTFQVLTIPAKFFMPPEKTLPIAAHGSERPAIGYNPPHRMQPFLYPGRATASIGRMSPYFNGAIPFQGRKCSAISIKLQINVRRTSPYDIANICYVQFFTICSLCMQSNNACVVRIQIYQF